MNSAKRDATPFVARRSIAASKTNQESAT